MKNISAGKNIFASIAGVITWAAVTAQLYLTLANSIASTAETLIRFFSYFTILVNILAALAFTAALSNRAAFFTRTKTLTAIAVFITIVGITYNVILRGIWAPQGLQLIVDETLHVIAPVLFILYWLLFVLKEKISWSNAFTWLWLPGIYFIYTLIRGYFTGWYPYPFVDAVALGYGKVAINCVFVCLAFILAAILFIGISRAAASKIKNSGTKE